MPKPLCRPLYAWGSIHRAETKQRTAVETRKKRFATLFIPVHCFFFCSDSLPSTLPSQPKQLQLLLYAWGRVKKQRTAAGDTSVSFATVFRFVFLSVLSEFILMLRLFLSLLSGPKLLQPFSLRLGTRQRSIGKAKNSRRNTPAAFSQQQRQGEHRFSLANFKKQHYAEELQAGTLYHSNQYPLRQHALKPWTQYSEEEPQEVTLRHSTSTPIFFCWRRLPVHVLFAPTSSRQQPSPNRDSRYDFVSFRPADSPHR
jgi:hypothetical protein